MERMQPTAFNEAVVEAWPLWLGKAFVARLLCRWGIHSWRTSYVEADEKGHIYSRHPPYPILCCRCGVKRGW